MNGLTLAFVLGTMYVMLANCHGETGAENKYTQKEYFFCKPSTGPFAKNLREAKQICDSEPTCRMFFSHDNVYLSCPEGSVPTKTRDNDVLYIKEEPLLSRTKLTVDGIMEANGLSCWTCPFDASGKDDCLIDGSKLGQSLGCPPEANACGTLLIDDVTAPLRYNRRCALNNGKDGCVKVNVRAEGKIYPGRQCFCSTGDDCNTNV